MSQLLNISANTPLQNYAAGAFQNKTRRVGQFLAPTVPTPNVTGRFKKWTEKSRFYLPNTLRSLNAEGNEITSDATDATFEGAVHGLNVTVDAVSGTDKDYLIRDGVDYLADIYGLAHLVEAVTKAKTAAGAGTNIVADGSSDIIEKIDEQIEAVIIAGKCEEVGVLFGAQAWRRFKNNTIVRELRQILNWERNPSLFTADAQYMTCHAFIDSKPEALSPVIQFLLQDEILIFGRISDPNRRDPSFMKTFRVDKYEELVKVAESRDGRRLIVTSDWAAAIEVTNSAAVQRINFTSTVALP